MVNKYLNLIFDCDGVILNSNKIKTEAFYNVAKVYGHEAAQALKEYHVRNGGISRYAKFEYFITKILGKTINQVELNNIIENFAVEVRQGLLTCEVAQGLDELRDFTKHNKWLLVSGGDQAELRTVFAERGLDTLFDGGIFGSPDSKDKILAREIKNSNITMPGLFIGDSKYDYQAAKRAGLDFVFITQWTEVDDWQKWSREEGIRCEENLKDLVFK